MIWAPVLPGGLRGNAWGSATMADTTTRVPNVGADASLTVGTLNLPALATTEDTSNTWSLPSKHWRRYRTHSAMPKQRRFCARESPLSMPYGTAAQRRAVLLRFKASAASATLESNLGISWATRLPLSAADLK